MVTVHQKIKCWRFVCFQVGKKYPNHPTQGIVVVVPFRNTWTNEKTRIPTRHEGKKKNPFHPDHYSSAVLPPREYENSYLFVPPRFEKSRTTSRQVEEERTIFYSSTTSTPLPAPSNQGIPKEVPVVVYF